ncbi:spectrin beta chain, non-erythrocytic 1 isoform X2 [Amia ocellicauda]|uniref:spectrin beta chain, non-erythrocytic 1 isoform X2 n=1 Tax=Amia ocellicauda TaxID=2972642 RepID=UPI003463CC7C
MSESIVRKVQPFTIGTKLSVPVVPKCTDFVETYLPSQALDNCKMQHNLNDQVSLYLGQSQIHPDASQFSPVATQEEMAEEDQLNRNAVSPTAASRSIRKINISSTMEATLEKGATVPDCHPPAIQTSKTENINNNNNSNHGSQPLPRIVGVSCENKPNSQFKVLLRKETNNEKQVQERCSRRETVLRCAGDKASTVYQTPELRAVSPRKHFLQTESQSCGQVETPNTARLSTPCHDYSLTQCNAQFNREILQAEAWIKGKLRDLKDGCNIQRCPLQDWEEVSQTLQRDLKDFENALIQLNQMGEQLICKQNPTSDLVKKQLSQLKDQWHMLKQTAANQSKALGGARNLQEFNRKVDKLEAWIKSKEEEQSLAKVLGETTDKIQLTRRILDLKQDEQQYRTLHEEINNLAHKLEKQGKNEGKNISARRKHINKMWLKVQSLLKDYHENLQLALEVSSFYQQADNIIRAITNKREHISFANDQANSADRDIRDIASQIMMLDVTVSQLSNLHPTLAARVTQKQGEVKDAWALLQKAVRNEKPGLQSPSSDFTREDGDPLTPARESQCSVGIESHRIMGKEVKEEQNRLKGCASAREPGTNRKLMNCQDEPTLSKSPTPVIEMNPSNADEAIRRTHGESRKEKTDSKTAFSRGNTHLHVQLQKFTVSADKTLSWLKDNVAMATQICCTASLDGFEAAKRCQATLEQEILSNRARIEVVKKEGRSLVRAQHPGSAKIEEFLGQLEVLWEELKKRHQKNVVVLQESEKLNLKVMKVLKDLDDLKAWLQTVESSIRQSALDRDPESVTAAERESSLLEREVASRGLALRALRQEVDKLRNQRHYQAEQLPSRMEEVEEKYRCVQHALKQQASELQDTRMLTEFLERVEMEESQEPRILGYVSCVEQALPSKLDSESSLLGLSDRGDQLIESIADPVEELREAVEMLNDTVRERGRSLTQDQGIQELLSRHSALTVRINERLSRSRELNADIQQMETEMAVKCEPDKCGLYSLEDQQDDLEIDYDVIKEDVDEMEKLAARLEDLCPERMHILAEDVQATQQAWEELGKSIAENRGRLRQFLQLQDFFRNYLAMISWTEDTRACIFSETPVHSGKGSQVPMTAELDVKIEQKFAEFDELAEAGQKLIDEEHPLTEMIKERTEELRSMLGWILVRWRAQKHQRNRGKRKAEPKSDVIYSEATVCTPHLHQKSPLPETPPTLKQTSERGQAQPEPPSPAQCSEELSEAGYEVMAQISQKRSDLSSPGGALQGLLAVESPESPFLVLKEPSAPSLGGTVNLILSFGKMGDSQLQLQDPVEEEPVHRPSESQSSACKNFWKRCQGLLENTFGSLKRKKKLCRQSAEEVSTYLHVKDNNKAMTPVYESITLPRLASKAGQPASTSPPPKVSSVSFHTLPKITSNSIFNSLKRRSKKKKKRDVRRHTIQKIMGVNQEESGIPGDSVVSYHTNTWPLKERKKGTKIPSPVHGQLLDYVKNPLAKDIDAECASISNFVQSESRCSKGLTDGATSQVKNNCKHLSLGSVLSFELPKDLSLISSIPDLIKIGPQELKGGHNLRNNTDAQDMYSRKSETSTERCAVLSTFKQPCLKSELFEKTSKYYPQQEVSLVNANHGSQQCDLDAYSVFSHCDQNSKREDHPQTKDPTIFSDDISDLKLNRLSRISGLHEEVGQEWEKLEAVLDSTGNLYRFKESSEIKCPTRTSNPVEDQKSVVKENEDYGDVDQSTEFPDDPIPIKVTGRSVPHEKTESAACNGELSGGDLGAAAVEVIHPDHQQFEEEEEELEDIWNRTNGYRQSICSDIMYQTYKAELADTTQAQEEECDSQGQDVLYRKLVTASAPNLLVAEFRLPPSIQNLLGYGKEQSTGDRNSLGSGNRKSWAASPKKEPPSKHIALVNETASDLVKLPDIDDQQKYIYQYREEEEEEDEVEEDTGYLKDQSVSLLSVHMGVQSQGKQPMSLGSVDCDRTEQGPLANSRGHCMTTRKSELQSMEGTLEKKHKLQLGGKKAPCRSWNTYHTVLFKQTLCFYQDRKDTLKSTVAGLPLNLIGAQCTPAPDYTKKANCFSLRLRDGSEYLLSASSRFLMKKWVLKIQANTGLSDSEISGPVSGHCMQDISVTTEHSPSHSCHCSSSCQCPQGGDTTSCLSGHTPATASVRAKEIIVLTRDNLQRQPWHHGNVKENSTAMSLGAGHCDYYGSLRQAMKQKLSQKGRDSSFQPQDFFRTEDLDCVANKRRSHSFTSATYQKITPFSLPPGAREGGSSYSVTLFIGDQLTESQRAQALPPTNNTESANQKQLPHMIGWHPETLLDTPGERNYASLPRPRNKSVFKKFFGKKE